LIIDAAKHRSRKRYDKEDNGKSSQTDTNALHPIACFSVPARRPNGVFAH